MLSLDVGQNDRGLYANLGLVEVEVHVLRQSRDVCVISHLHFRSTVEAVRLNQGSELLVNLQSCAENSPTVT